MEEKIKNLLREYNSICSQINQSEKSTKNYMELIDTCREISGISYEGVAVQTSNISNVTEDTAMKIDQYNIEIQRNRMRIAKLYDKRYAVEELLLDIDPVKGEIIKFRFFHRMKWRQIPRLVNYSKAQSQRLCDEAIRQMVFKVINNDNLYSIIGGDMK